MDFVGGLVCRYGEKGGKEKHRSFLSYVVLCACLKSENGCRKIATKVAHWFVQNYHKRGKRRSFAKKVEELCNESGDQDNFILPKS